MHQILHIKLAVFIYTTPNKYFKNCNTVNKLKRKKKGFVSILSDKECISSLTKTNKSQKV